MATPEKSNYPSKQPAPESASGLWGRRYEKSHGRAPLIDQTSGKYKVNGQAVARAGKTRWDRGGSKEQQQ